ncbi:MAG: transposase [Treponema sp.]|jgi:putative transposase|nr:transposase [Treponema sp.]
MHPLRILRDGATYHVTSKTDHDDMSLLEPQFKKLFLMFVERAKRKFHFQLWNFCVMGNHIHFLIKPTKEGNLSKIMQWIKSNFAKAWNKAHGKKGHVWGERFFSRIINSAREFLQISNYIDENPVKAGLVHRSTDWVFGGLYYWLHKCFDIIDDLTEPESLFAEHQLL